MRSLISKYVDSMKKTCRWFRHSPEGHLMVFEGKHHMLWAYEAYEEKAKFTGRMWRWGTWGNHRLRTMDALR